MDVDDFNFPLDEVDREGNPVAWRVRHRGDTNWVLSTYDPTISPDGQTVPDIESEPLFTRRNPLYSKANQ